MQTNLRTVPQPLVRTNQWFIVLSVVSAWITGFEWILVLPLGAGILGLVFGFNPVMRIAKTFLKKATSEYIPEDWEQQQFNQLIAVICLAGGLISYSMNLNGLGHFFTIMVALAAFIAILGFCVGCFIRFQWKKFRARKTVVH
ncbi:DUF4395 domain-containing protein [Heyndrickxia sp. MSNUG]|uniref:DUF4395 domain-containing protein n=1 Tax=Heyndrickxia sp. MSNUG TaxID=3136677 RepID=UPI003C2BA57E